MGQNYFRIVSHADRKTLNITESGKSNFFIFKVFDKSKQSGNLVKYQWGFSRIRYRIFPLNRPLRLLSHGSSLIN